VRNVHTFLFADLTGYTALTEAHGDERAAKLAGDFFACVRGLLDEHAAHEVKTIGDAVMLRCERASEAVSLGLAIVEAVDAEEWFPTVRVGMSTGEAVEREGDWFGSTVNLAARIAGAAGGAEVLLSGATREAAGEVDGVEFHRHGQVELRNLPQAVALFRAVRVGEQRERRPVDPVCRMTIAAGASAGHLVHAGVEYQFCSLRCAGEFAKDPARYVPSED
jgi:class 3 adenylate cyclase